MMAVIKIIVYQYHIWDIWVRSEKQRFFCRKQTLNDRNHGQEYHSAKLGGDSTPNILKFIRPIWLGILLKKGFIWHPYSVSKYNPGPRNLASVPFFYKKLRSYT